MVPIKQLFSGKQTVGTTWQIRRELRKTLADFGEISVSPVAPLSRAAFARVPIMFESSLSKYLDGSIMMPQTHGAFERRRRIGETPL
jgi:hypothetical protein